MNYQNYKNLILLTSSDTKQTVMHLFLFTKSVQRELVFNMYAEYTQQQLSFLALVPCINVKKVVRLLSKWWTIHLILFRNTTKNKLDVTIKFIFHLCCLTITFVVFVSIFKVKIFDDNNIFNLISYVDEVCKKRW